MRFLVTGFNGYGQWLTNDLVNKSFTAIPESFKDNFKLSPNDEYRIYIGWSYNVYITNDSIYLTGYNNREIYNGFRKLETANLFTCKNLLNLIVQGNDNYILFLDVDNQNLWKFILESDQWKLITTFLNIENDISSGNFSDQKILDIKCSNRLAIATTNLGLVYCIPNVLDLSNITGKPTEIDCGFEHGMLLTDQGNIYTWGMGSRCQLGHGSTDSSESPRLVDALSGIDIVKVRAGGWHCCALSSTGDLYVWGWNDQGQLGISEEHNNHSKTGGQIDEDMAINKVVFTDTKDTVNYSVPTLVDFYTSDKVCLDVNVIDVSCGTKHTVVMLEDRSIWATGWNEYCQLGLDSDSCQKLSYFRKVYQANDESRVCCGPWSTVVYVD